MNNLFASLDTVTIETLKARLAAQQEAEGPGAGGDLSALLRAAKIELSLDDIVLPPLNQVRKQTKWRKEEQLQRALLTSVI